MSPENNVSPLQPKGLRDALDAYDTGREYDDLLRAAKLVFEKRLAADPIIERIKRDYDGALDVAAKFLSSMAGDSDLLMHHLAEIEKLIESEKLQSLEHDRITTCWPELRSLCQWLKSFPVTCLSDSPPIDSIPVAEPDARVGEMAKAIGAAFLPVPDTRYRYFPAARDTWEGVAEVLGQFDPLPTITNYVESLFPVNDETWVDSTNRPSESDAGRILMLQGLICAAVEHDPGQDAEAATNKEIALAVLGGVFLFGSDHGSLIRPVFLALTRGSQPLFDVAMYYWLIAFDGEDPQPGWATFASILLDLNVTHNTHSEDQDELSIHIEPTSLARHIASVYCAYLNDNALDPADEETLGYGIDRASRRLADLAKISMRSPVSIDELGLVATASLVVGTYHPAALYENLWLGLAHEFDASQAGFPTTLSLNGYGDHYTPNRNRWPVVRSLLQSVYETRMDELGDALLCWFLISESIPTGQTLSSIWSDLQSYVRSSLESPRHEMVVHCLDLASGLSGMRDDALGQRLLHSMLSERDRLLLNDRSAHLKAVPSIRVPARPYDLGIDGSGARLCGEAQKALKSARFHHEQLASAMGIHTLDCGILATGWFKPIEIELKHRLKGIRHRNSFKGWCQENDRDPDTFATLVLAIRECGTPPQKFRKQIVSACGALADDRSLLDDILTLAQVRNIGSHQGTLDISSYAEFISLLFGEKKTLQRFIDSLPDRA